MLDIRFCEGGCRRVPVRYLCLFWLKTHKKGLHARYPTRPEVNEGRQSPRAEQKERAFNRSQLKRAVKRREQELEPVDSEDGLANVRGLVSVPGGFVVISLEYMLTIAYRCTES